MSSPTIRNRSKRATSKVRPVTERIPALTVSTPLVRLMNMFTRRANKAEKATPAQLRINGKPIILTRSSLRIKRRMDARHVVARQARKLTRGLCGKLTWSDFDKLPTDEKGHFLIPESPRNRLFAAQMDYLKKAPRDKDGNIVRIKPRSMGQSTEDLRKLRRMPTDVKKRLTVRIPHVNIRHNHMNVFAGLPCHVTKDPVALAKLAKSKSPLAKTAKGLVARKASL